VRVLVPPKAVEVEAERPLDRGSPCWSYEGLVLL